MLCYETLQCDSGVLCLDWRDICDGVQQCLEGRDGENCDLLEMNQCDQDEEYRCENGMCIPQDFFLDGELDWYDEMQFKDTIEWPFESVSRECDDHLCLFSQWSCGDGQCFADRFVFQTVPIGITCESRRDQYFICETTLHYRQWTMPNGRCFQGGRYESLSVTNRNDEEQCEYLLKCALSQGAEKNCPCYRDSRCVDELSRKCCLPLIRYPRRAVVTRFTFFLFNPIRNLRNKQPNFIEINGTVRCRDALVTVRGKRIPFDTDLIPRQISDEHFCGPFVSNILEQSFSYRS